MPRMKSTRTHAVVLVTTPNLQAARALIEIVLHQKLAACVNLVRGLESYYWWKGQLERSTEVLLLIKTRRALLPKLERAVLDHHPYDTPEFVVLNIAAGSESYLRWIDSSVSPVRRSAAG
jgi:periplasmic divalent cation tolerance protein